MAALTDERQTCGFKKEGRDRMITVSTSTYYAPDHPTAIMRDADGLSDELRDDRV